MAKNKKGNEEELEILDLDTEEQNDFQEYEEKEGFFRRLKNKWDNLGTKQKSIIIVVTVVILIAIISTILYFVLTKEDKKDQKSVIIIKDNYRYQDGTLYFLNNRKEIGSYKCKNKDEDLCYVAYEENDDSFDEPIIKKAKEEKVRSKIYQNKYVFVYDNEKETDGNIILYDIKNNKQLDAYQKIKTYANFDDAVFALDLEDKYGILDLSSKSKKNIVDFDYDYLGIMAKEQDSKKDIIVASEKSGNYLLDFDGKKLTKTLPGTIKDYNAKYVKTTDASNKYILYDYEGNKIDEDLNYLDLLDDYYLKVDNENKLLIAGYDKTKYLEEGLPLYNTNYVPIITQDKKGKETTKEYAYTYTLADNKITFKINNEGKEEETTINLLDGLVSKNLKYINYFNGTLYFYSDEEKNTLINSYICNNKNDLKDANGTLETCKIAGDTNEDDNETNQKITPATYTPLFNNRYIFIQDGNMINLVDLTDEKVLGTYSLINTYGDATQTNPYLLTTQEQFVFAKNKNNKYGLIKINESSVSSVYGFEYDKLEKLNQNILAKKDGKTYLLDYNGNKITYDFPGQIRNYLNERIKVLADKKYYVYDFGGNLVFEDGYKYVELYSDFVGLVDDANHLTVMDYDGNRLINEVLKLSSSVYYNAQDGYVPAFTMRKENNKLIITAATSENTKKEKAKDFTYDLTTKKRIS